MSFNETICHWLGRALGLEEMQSVADYKFSFAASWAQRAPMLLFFGIAGLVAAAALFYFRHQATRRRGWRVALFLIRAAVLCQVLLLLAEPILTLSVQSRKRPALWLLFDGTDSMNIADDLPADVRAATDKAVGWEEHGAASTEQGAGNSAGSPLTAPRSAILPPSRIDYLRALASKKDHNLLESLSKDFRLQGFLFESRQGVRSLEMGRGIEPVDGKHLAEQLTANGQVTDLGGALNDLAHRNATSSLAGLIVFSDFANTTGPAPAKAAEQFGAKIYTVGVGAIKPVELTAKVVVAANYARPKDEVRVSVVLTPTGLAGQTTRVRLYAESSAGARTLVGEKVSPPLTGSMQTIDFVFKAEQPGRIHLTAEVDRVPGEVNRGKNLARGDIVVVDDYLRLMFVAYEPTWEWRFIKEVFHRDPLVGLKGFRTFLYSSDPQVRQQNELFLPTMTPPREDFFKYDLIFLGDMPSGPPTPALNERFCRLVKEFVGNKGGGLVILSGPRFGPQQLAKTALADLLPVTVDPQAQVRDQQPFKLQLTTQAADFPFMQLGAGSSLPEMQHEWDNLDPLPWYQPVTGIHPSATVLAEHPTATCAGGQRQPLIAIRRYGRGEVVYLGFDETWRLRRAHGEELYRKFWKEVMWRLALNHDVGVDKRFVAKTEQQRYQVDQVVKLTVDAYDAQYNVLSQSAVPGGKLHGTWILPAQGTQKAAELPLTLTQVQPGLFSTQFVVTTPGEHRGTVVNPLTQKSEPWSFTAYSASAERRTVTRNKPLQDTIATDSGGRSCDLMDVQSLLEQIQPALRTETSVEVVSLVHTWACFLAIAGLLLVEWLLRKRIGLP